MKLFYIGWKWLSNFSLVASVFMILYLMYLGTHVLLFWFRNVR